MNLTEFWLKSFQVKTYKELINFTAFRSCLAFSKWLLYNKNEEMI